MIFKNRPWNAQYSLLIGMQRVLAYFAVAGESGQDSISCHDE